MITEILKLIAEKGPMLCVAYSRIMRHGSEPSNNSYDSTKENRIIMNEDFVTYELAVKLKEKGFKELCLAYYTNDDTLYYNYSHKSGACYTDCYLSHNLMPKNSVSGKFVDAPTISQVLKWLREEKGMEVYSSYNRVYKHWTYIARAFDDSCYNSVGGFKSYEQAALAGIEDVLDKLN